MCRIWVLSRATENQAKSLPACVCEKCERQRRPRAHHPMAGCPYNSCASLSWIVLGREGSLQQAARNVSQWTFKCLSRRANDKFPVKPGGEYQWEKDKPVNKQEVQKEFKLIFLPSFFKRRQKLKDLESSLSGWIRNFPGERILWGISTNGSIQSHR